MEMDQKKGETEIGTKINNMDVTQQNEPNETETKRELKMLRQCKVSILNRRCLIFHFFPNSA